MFEQRGGIFEKSAKAVGFIISYCVFSVMVYLIFFRSSILGAVVVTAIIVAVGAALRRLLQ